MWKVEPGFYQESLIECFEHQGVLVTVHPVGCYPTVKHTDGTLGTGMPRIEILLDGGCLAGQRFYTGALIKVKKPSAGSRTRELVAWEVKGETVADASGYITLAKQKLGSAVLLLKGMDVVFEEGYARVKQGANYKEPFLSRVDYERACVALGVGALADSDCRGYRVRHGIFSFPEYDPDFILKMSLASLRFRGLELTPTKPNSVSLGFPVGANVNYLAPAKSESR